MTLLVSDTSVMIDLDRGDLIEAAFAIGETFIVPDLLFERELNDEFGARLVGLGLRIEALESAEVARATQTVRLERRLSIPDSFAFALAHGRGWTLLTGDQTLRGLATSEGVAVHGVLWVLDQIESGGICDGQTLHAGLSKTSSHPRCRLPKREVELRLRRYLCG